MNEELFNSISEEWKDFTKNVTMSEYAQLAFEGYLARKTYEKFKNDDKQETSTVELEKVPD